MDVYQYIAENNPDAAYEICKKYGYFDIRSLPQLSETLNLVVSNGGEESFKEIMKLHPDKSVLLELFMPEKKSDTVIAENIMPVKEDCSCKKNATGDAAPTVTPANTVGLVTQTNMYILVGALIVSLAIISMKNN